MLYHDNLEEIIFHRHEMFSSDELIVISGYIGPRPVVRMGTLPLNAKVIYGMYGSEGIKRPLHNSLIGLQTSIDNLNIFYSNIPVHSKCYVWRRKREVVHALIGSANFSVNGLTTPYREILAETTSDTFDPLNRYIDFVLANSRSCLEIDLAGVEEIEETTPDYCFLTLLARDGKVHNAAGLNWGQNPNNHTRPNDAYIPIRVQDIKNFPDLFPPKQEYPTETDHGGRMQRHNDSVEIIWDDGVSMQGLLEGSQVVEGLTHPKQVSSFPVKSELGEYFRERLGIPSGQPVRKFHLENYGRTDIAVSLLSEGVYRFDFSRPT
jgi:hypothetical protein